MTVSPSGLRGGSVRITSSQCLVSAGRGPERSTIPPSRNGIVLIQRRFRILRVPCQSPIDRVLDSFAWYQDLLYLVLPVNRWFFKHFYIPRLVLLQLVLHCTFHSLTFCTDRAGLTANASGKLTARLPRSEAFNIASLIADFLQMTDRLDYVSANALGMFSVNSHPYREAASFMLIGLQVHQPDRRQEALCHQQWSRFDSRLNCGVNNRFARPL
jgi:hypothetical protein